MTAIETKADATVFKSGPFWKRRYTLVLFINGKHAGIQWNVTRKQAKTLPKALVDNAAEVLSHYGLMDTAYGLAATGATPTTPLAPEPAAVHVKELVTPDGATLDWPKTFTRAIMPKVSQKVALAVTIGHFPKGLVGTVTRVDEWLDSVSEENQYPVRVALTHGPDTVELPLHLHEIEVVR